MRKQYHFWPGAEGLDAWDVDRLIRESAHLPVIDVPLSTITEVDREYWFIPGSQSPTVRAIVEHYQLIRDVDLSYPIILGVDGRVMDGMHRVARAMADGRSSVKAVQFEAQPEPDYRNCRPEDLTY